MGLQQDILKRIVNVNWGGGIAVEFDEASSLTLNYAMNMNKAAVAFWFRVPAASLEAARAMAPGGFWGFRVMFGVVPLITWGEGGAGVDANGNSAQVSPSYIGVRAGTEEEPPALDIHIQTNDFSGGGSTGEGPDYFGNSEAGSTHLNVGTPEIVPDQWHHLLISWELRSHDNQGGGGDMWCVLDGLDKSGDDLPGMHDMGLGDGANEHKAQMPHIYQGDLDHVVGIAVTQIDSFPLIIPASGTVAYTSGPDSIDVKNPRQTVELAELYVYSSRTLVSSDVFIQNGKPADSAKVVESLGKPDVLLHGTSNWQKGKNTGNLDNLDPDGEIKKYSPDPELGEEE